MSMTTSRRRRGRVIGTLVIVAILLVVVAALVFQPWKLFVDRTVQEAAPVASNSASGPTGTAAPVVLARGTLVSQEHETSGTVEVLRLPDGSRVLRLNDLKTSNGPVVRVWLSDAKVVDGTEGWFAFDDGRYVDLGDLKGNVGSSNYPVPADADLSTLRSVSIWCARFTVSFGAATLEPVAP